MGKTPFGTVKETGADEEDVLVGISPLHNAGLLIRLYNKQGPGSGGRIKGSFQILHQGTGAYAEGIKAVINQRQTFETAQEFIKSVTEQKDCADCTHILNANSLWRLNIEMINNKLLKSES